MTCLPCHELIPKVAGSKLGTVLNDFSAPGMSHPASWRPSSVSFVPSARLWHFPLPSHLEPELHKDETQSFQFHMFSLLALSLWLPQRSLPLNRRGSTIPLSAPLRTPSPLARLSRDSHRSAALDASHLGVHTCSRSWLCKPHVAASTHALRPAMTLQRCIPLYSSLSPSSPCTP